MAFFGDYQVSVTSGGRIVLPKKIRENFAGSTFILTKGYDICLAGYEKSDWSRRSSALLDVSLIDKENIDRRRHVFSGAVEIEIDDQGRFVVPKSLANYIGLNVSQAVIVGVGDHFEVWNSDKWSEYLKKINI